MQPSSAGSMGDGVERAEGARWEFDGGVTDAFDGMLEKSVPQYAEMRRLVFEVGSRFVQFQTDVVDLGCSRAAGLQPFIDKFGAQNRYVGVEVSQPMLAAARERLSGLIACNCAAVLDLDLRRSYPPGLASLTLSVLTLQFTPIEHRQRIVHEAHRHTLPGGALIVVEKVIGSSALVDEHLVEVHHALKRQNGYTPDEIARKRMALEGVLVPVTARWNEELLHAAGFRHVECFWRWANFAAWVAVKDGEPPFRKK